MPDPRPFDDFHPIAFAEAMQSLWWDDLDEIHAQVIARMQTLAEASGAPVGGRVSSSKPEGNAPRGDISLVDQHRPDIQRAIDRDLADLERGQAPRQYRLALLRAFIALHQFRFGTLRVAGVPEVDDFDLEREERIASGYPGLAAEVVAQLETAQGGWVLASAVRACRKRNGRHPETGDADLMGRDQRIAEAKRLRAGGELNAKPPSYADIGRILGCAPSTVMRMLRSADDDQAAA